MAQLRYGRAHVGLLFNMIVAAAVVLGGHAIFRRLRHPAPKNKLPKWKPPKK